MEGEEQDKSIETFIKKMGLIPFNGTVELKLFDLMKVAQIQPGRDARVVPMAAAFTDEIFGAVKLTRGQADLRQLLSEDSVEECKPEDFRGVYEETNITLGDTTAALLKGVVGGGGKGGTSSEKKGRFSLKKMLYRSLDNSPYLIDFVREHLPTLITNVPAFQVEFGQARLTRFSGSSNMVIAIVMANLTGTCESHIEASQAKSGEVTVAAPEAELKGGCAHSSAREGVLGASYYVCHLSKNFEDDRIKLKNSCILKTQDDPNLKAFLSRSKFKGFQRLFNSYPRSSFGFLTAKEQDPLNDSYESLQDHADGMAKDDRFASLGLREWGEGQATVSVEVRREDTVPLMDEHHLPEGDLQQRKIYESSWNYIFTGSLEMLSRKYRELKGGKAVQLGGMTVSDLSPAFEVEVSNFLPIYYLGGNRKEDEEGRDTKIPGSVVRDYEGAVFIFPVEKHWTNESCVTVYSEEWEVRESILHVKRDDTDQIKDLKAKGFHQIVMEPEACRKSGEIVMARHQLARYTDPPDDGTAVVRVPPTDVASGNAAAVAESNAVPSLRTFSEEGKNKKQKTTK